jgi:metal-dependent hydrolase (beta-lactamase superfamily II)
MKLHILTENRAARRGFLAEHGLSILIESSGLNVLLTQGRQTFTCATPE